MPDTPDGAADRLSELLATHCRALQEWLRAGAAGRAPTPDAALAAWRAAHPDTGETFERTLAQGLRFVGLVEELLRNLDATCSALGLASQQELRKLLDLLAIAPLRYVLTGVGAWNEAGVDKMQAFLSRWRGSRFATLNAGGNVLVKLTASSFYVLPESWPSTGYPGPLEYVFNAINS